ncbi:hypothetical protein ACJJTC_009482 [Scirpophaga incertulas]
MITIPENVYKIFDEVLQEMCQNIRELMKELWVTWSHIGIDENGKYNNIRQLVQIENEFHREVMSESIEKFKLMQQQIDKLKEETEQLSKCLSVDIPIIEYKEDMMLIEYMKELEEQIAEYREQVEQRHKKMKHLQEWQEGLAEQLGVTIHNLQYIPLPSEEELDKLTNHLEVLQAERNKRAEIFLNTQLEVKDIMEKLRIKPQNKFEQLVVTSQSIDFKLTDQNMDLLATLEQDLQEKYECTNNRVLELRERLTKLWDCLEEDHIYRENFLHAHPGCHKDTEMAIKEEIERCDKIKRQKIQVFVANVRTKIKLMWDNIMYSSKQREEFVLYFQDHFTEDTLMLHELYLEKITKFYNENKQIFDLVVTRKNLWIKMTELEARASEPGRYHNRGGQLLREEKDRKALCSNLPKIEAQIRDLVKEYEGKTGQVFTVEGKPLVQLIEEDWENRKAERHKKLSARKEALTPNTPRPLAVSPLGKRNRTAAGLPATGDRNRPPSKRQLITGSATKAMSSVSSSAALSAAKRTAVTTVKRRISGRLAARAVAEMKGEFVKRKLDYNGDQHKTPKVAVNGSILRHKRTSHGKRRSITRPSKNTTLSSNDDNDPLMESTLLTTYSIFKDNINEKQISRSSLAYTNPPERNLPHIDYASIEEKNTPDTPKKTSKFPIVLTPKVEKENVHQHIPSTPKNNIFSTPSRLTRSTVKINNGFATPRTPLSANKVNLQRQNTITNLQVKNSPELPRSKSHANIVRVKKLPAII